MTRRHHENTQNTGTTSVSDPIPPKCRRDWISRTATALCFALTVAVGTTNANESDWAGLDAELTALTTSMVKDGPTVSGYLEATYDSDAEVWGVGRNVVTVSGDNGGYGYHVSIDGGSASEGNDAYITFTMGGIGWTMGDFRAPGTGNHLANENDTTFMDRDAIGGGGARSHGLMASGSMDALGYMIHIGNDENLSARVTYDVMSGDGINLSVAYATDEGADQSWIEANVSSGPFGLSYTTGDEGVEDDASSLVGCLDHRHQDAHCPHVQRPLDIDPIRRWDPYDGHNVRSVHRHVVQVVGSLPVPLRAEHEARSIWRPIWVAIEHGVVRYVRLPGPVRVHQEDFLHAGAVNVGLKSDLRAVGGPLRERVLIRVVRESGLARPVCVHDVYLGLPAIAC